VNFSNHPSTQWAESQLVAARHYGEVLDLPFPDVDPHWDERDVLRLAEQYANEVLRLHPVAVMCQGEFSLCVAVIQLLQAKGVMVLCACSERNAEAYMNDDGSMGKRVSFAFVRFRKYRLF